MISLAFGGKADASALAPSSPLSRRAFLKIGAAGLAAGLGAPAQSKSSWAAPSELRLGRVTRFDVDIRLRPDPDSPLLRQVQQDSLLTIYGAVSGIGELPHN